MIKILSTVTPKILVIAAACANAAQDLGITTTVTTGRNGKHKEGSLHYTYSALDIRSKDLQTGMKMLFLSKVMERLGANYQGFLEDESTANEHFHIEYDPSS